MLHRFRTTSTLAAAAASSHGLKISEFRSECLGSACHAISCSLPRVLHAMLHHSRPMSATAAAAVSSCVCHSHKIQSDCMVHAATLSCLRVLCHLPEQHSLAFMQIKFQSQCMFQASHVVGSQLVALLSRDWYFSDSSRNIKSWPSCYHILMELLAACISCLPI